MNKVLSLGNGLELCTGLVSKTQSFFSQHGRTLAFLFLFGLVMVLGSSSAMAQTSTPVEVVEGAGATAQTAWTTFAGISAASFVFGMVIAYGRKGKK